MSNYNRVEDARTLHCSLILWISTIYLKFNLKPCPETPAKYTFKTPSRAISKHLIYILIQLSNYLPYFHFGIIGDLLHDQTITKSHKKVFLISSAIEAAKI